MKEIRFGRHMAKSGHKGISRIDSEQKKMHGWYVRVRYENEVYEVSWNAGREKKGRTSVSIRKYGEARAFRMACAIRREKERQMYGEPVAAKWAGALSKVCAA